MEASASKPSGEQRLEGQILIRQITHYQPTWTERDRGAPGSFTIQLILDHGADEYVIHPDAEDAEVLVSLFTKAEKSGTEVWFDLGRKLVMFGNRSLT